MAPQEGSGTRLQVFMSHQWRDKQVADRLGRDLESFADVWMDFRNLRPGDRIQERIDEALARMDLVLLVWTDHAKASQGVKAEIEKSLELGIRVVPLILAYDEAGRPAPALDPPLNDLLGVDLHHYGSGLAQISHFLLQLQAERLPKGAGPGPEHPGMRMLEHLRGYLSYLANYRKVAGVEDRRGEWIERIVGEIERYVRGGGDPASVRALLEVARRSEVEDAEGIGMLVQRLEALLGDDAGPAPGGSPQAHPAGPSAPTGNLGVPAARPHGAASGASGWRPPAPPPPDVLAERVEQVVPAGTAAHWLAEVHAYVDAAPMALEALDRYARSVGSPAGVQVTAYLRSYLENADDLVPLHHGRYGLLDDAWLILNTAFRLVESGVVPAAVVPVDWTRIIQADHVVRAVVPPDALQALTAMVFELLQAIAQEVQSYQPWFTPQGHGYAPTMARPAATGGTWEDEMNRRLLGTGLSVDG